MRTILSAALLGGALALSAQAQQQPTGSGPLAGCGKSWAQSVVKVTGEVDPLQQPASNLLGDTPGTSLALAPGGCVVVAFGGPTTQDGTPFSDFGIDVVDAASCYEVALKPSDPASRDLLVNAGWEAVGGGFYRPFGVIECGDQNWDVDFYAPGLAPGSLSVDALRLCVPAGAPAPVEFARAWSNQVCPCIGPPAAVESKPCGFGPLDPVLTADPFELFTAPKLYVDSQFPGVPGWIYYSAPAQQALNVNGCDFWLTAPTLAIWNVFVTDQSGDHVEQLPLLGPSLVGVELALQARVCSPDFQTPGPFAPAPDFFSNTLIVRIGCPPTAPAGN